VRRGVRCAVLAALFAALTAFACSDRAPSRVTVFAASSLREACDDVAELWRAEHPDADLVFNFAASNFLAQQIEATRAADLFLSADSEQLERVRRAGAIASDGPKPWLSNQLVVVAPASASSVVVNGAADLSGPLVARLSLANPQAVPAGKYARKWLEAQGVWRSVEARAVPGVDVRAALAAVEAGACELGVVYATDAAISERVRVVFRVPPEQCPRIEYSLAALRGPAPAPLVAEALAHFSSPAADACFARRGFVVPGRH
jgi:molybdate transport system substrate-binding protein